MILTQKGIPITPPISKAVPGKRVYWFPRENAPDKTVEVLEREFTHAGKKHVSPSRTVTRNRLTGEDISKPAPFIQTSKFLSVNDGSPDAEYFSNHPRCATSLLYLQKIGLLPEGAKQSDRDALLGQSVQIPMDEASFVELMPVEINMEAFRKAQMVQEATTKFFATYGTIEKGKWATPAGADKEALNTRLLTLAQAATGQSFSDPMDAIAQVCEVISDPLRAKHILDLMTNVELILAEQIIAEMVSKGKVQKRGMMYKIANENIPHGTLAQMIADKDPGILPLITSA